MKLLTLKTKFNRSLWLLGLVTAVSITENAFSAITKNSFSVPRIPQVKNNAEVQIANILERCLFAQDEKKPFSYYVNELIRLVRTNKEYLEAKSGKNGLAEIFIKDMESIKNLKNPIKVGRVLSRYKDFAPSLKQKKLGQLLAGLKFRLAISDDGNFDEAIAAANQSYINIFIGYCKVLFESGKEYFTRQ